MKDLYRNLDMTEATSEPTKIQQAIARCADVDTADAARYILLHPQRKEVYDRHHGLLKTIGTLRARLSLTLSPHWAELGNDDFEQASPTAPVDLSDLLTDLDLDSELSSGAPVHRLHRKTWLDFDVGQAAMIGAGLAVTLVLLIVIVRFATAARSLPDNGNVVYHVDLPNDSTMSIETRQAAGHNAVDVVSSADQQRIVSVFVREGQSATVDLPSGEYELRFSIGSQSEWDGRSFRRPLREVKPKSIALRAGQTLKLKIP